MLHSKKPVKNDFPETKNQWINDDANWVHYKMNEANNEYHGNEKVMNNESGNLVDASADTIVDPPFTETYESDFSNERRENKIINEEKPLENKKTERNEQMKSISEVIDDLRSKGYIHDFEIEYDLLNCRKTVESFIPEDLIIDEIHRFEGDSSPDDMAIIYAISSFTGTKGLIIDAYGTYSNSQISDFIKRVPVRGENEVHS